MNQQILDNEKIAFIAGEIAEMFCLNKWDSVYCIAAMKALILMEEEKTGNMVEEVRHPCEAN